jgi:hypothetical protein
VFEDSIFGSKTAKISHWVKKEAETGGVCKLFYWVFNQLLCLVNNKKITMQLTSRDGSKVGELQVTVNGVVERRKRSTRTGSTTENGETSSNGVNHRRSGQQKSRDTIMASGPAPTNRNSTPPAPTEGTSSEQGSSLLEGWEERKDEFGRT